MRGTVYDSAPEIARPLRFAQAAWSDLRESPRIGQRLFSSSLRGRARRSLLGYLWLLIPPAAATAMCVYLNSLGIIAVGETQLPYPLHVLSGVLLWQIFAEAIHAPAQQLLAARHLISKSPLPHEALFLAGLFDVALSAAIRTILLTAAFWVFVGPTLPGPAFLAGLAAMIMLGSAIGVAAAGWVLLLEDTSHLLRLATTFWFVATPIAYPAVKSGLLAHNPVTPLLETARSGFTGAPLVDGLLGTSAAAALLLVIAWLLYRIARPHLVERLG
jgi:lipopolysaccharide transport system permease protein